MRWTAVLLVFTIGLGLRVGPIPLAAALSVAALPFAFSRRLHTRRAALAILGLVVAAIGNGVLLAVMQSSRGPVDGQVAAQSAIVLSSGGLYVLTVLWASRATSTEVVTIAFAVGVMVSSIGGFANGVADLFKFAWALPLLLLATSLAKRISVLTVAILVLATLGLASGARSFGFLSLASLALCWLAASALGRGRGWKRLLAVSLIISAAWIGDRLLSAVMSSGVLGAAVQARTTANLAQGSTLLSGARPEWAATTALFTQQPWGYGLGAVPTTGDVLAAGESMRQAGYLSLGDYFYLYMFGGHIKLHSVAADLWVSFGLAGLLIAAIVLIVLVRAIFAQFDAVAPSFSGIVVSVFAIWYVFFGPILTDHAYVAFAVGVGLALLKPFTSREKPRTTGGLDVDR